MTEYWKSNPMYWCDYCKVWMQDNPQARATHEKGIKHKDNVARKLRTMRQTADKDARDQRLAASSMDGIDARAKQQYEQDLQAAQHAKAKAAGEWVFDDKSALHYNAQHRYYYDRSTQMYYGGDPPAWTLEPSLSKEALFDAEPRQQEGMEAPQSSSRGAVFGGTASGRPAPTKRSHPLSHLGGYQMPSVGAIGGAKQLTNPAAPKVKAMTPPSTVNAKKKQKLSEEEESAIAKRDAARARVQQRTMQSFGLA